MGVKQGFLGWGLLSAFPGGSSAPVPGKVWERAGLGVSGTGLQEEVAGGQSCGEGLAGPRLQGDASLGDRVTGGGQSKWCWEGQGYQGEGLLKSERSGGLWEQGRGSRPRAGPGPRHPRPGGVSFSALGWAQQTPCLLELPAWRSDVLHAVLVRRQVALEGLVAPQQGPYLLQRSRLVVPLAQHLLLSCMESPACVTQGRLRRGRGSESRVWPGDSPSVNVGDHSCPAYT